MSHASIFIVLCLTWSPVLPVVSVDRKDATLGVPDGLVEGLMKPLPGPAQHTASAWAVCRGGNIASKNW